jgi:hypothetical protein
MAVQVTMYLNEADEWQHRPLYLQVLNYLHEQQVFGATAFHAVAGFTGHTRVKTASLVEGGGKLPVIITFVESDESAEQVLPHLVEMAPHRLIVRENVQVVQGSFD